MATGAAVKQAAYPLNILATGAIAAKRFVTHAGTQAGAAAKVLGVSDTAIASGEYGVVDVFGITVVEAGAVLNGSEKRLQTDADGRAVAYTAGPVVAYLANGSTSTAAGQEISVLLIQNAP